MADQIISWLEFMVGADHPTMSDTLNRGLLVEHLADGSHGDIDFSNATAFIAEHTAAGVHDNVRGVNQALNADWLLNTQSTLAQKTTGRQTAYELGSADFDDDCADDDTADAAYGVSNCTLAFDTDHYELTGAAGGASYLSIALSGLTAGKLYKFSIEIKNGTYTWTTSDYIDVVDSGITVEYTQTKLASAAAFTGYSVIWLAQSATDKLRVYIVNLGAGSIAEIRNIHAQEVGPGYTSSDAAKAPDWWAKTSTLDIVRVQNQTTYHKGLYGLRITAGAATAEDLYNSGYADTRWLKLFAGREVTFGMWVYSVSVSDNARLYLYDGSTYTYSSYATADTLEWLEVTATLSASGTRAQIGVSMDGDASDVCYVSQPMLVFGPSIGEGGYAPPSPQWYPAVSGMYTHTFYSTTRTGADVSRYIEAETAGKIGKGVRLVQSSINGVGSAAGVYVLVKGTGYFWVIMVAVNNSATMYNAGMFDIDSNGAFLVSCSGTWTNFAVTIGGVFL